MNKELLENTLQHLNAACNESEDINQNRAIGQAIENLQNLIALAASIGKSAAIIRRDRAGLTVLCPIGHVVTRIDDAKGLPAHIEQHQADAMASYCTGA